MRRDGYAKGTAICMLFWQNTYSFSKMGSIFVDRDRGLDFNVDVDFGANVYVGASLC